MPENILEGLTKTWHLNRILQNLVNARGVRRSFQGSEYSCTDKESYWEVVRGPHGHWGLPNLENRERCGWKHWSWGIHFKRPYLNPLKA